MGAGVYREWLMTTDYLAAPENTAQSLAPKELIRLLIGSTIEEVERALVVQTLARCDGNRTQAAGARPIGTHAAQQDPSLHRRRDRGARAPLLMLLVNP
jgi:hypothetical protein